VGVIEGGLGPEGLVGGGVDGGVADGELPGAVERDDGLAEGDGGRCVGRLDARRGRVRGIRLLRFRFGGLSDRGKAEKRQQQDRKRFRYIPIEHVRVTNEMGLILIRTIAEYLLRDIRLSSLSSKRPNGQTNPEAHRLMRISDRNRTLA
jgi:hypothetical protein